MLISGRRSGRIAFAALIVITLIAALVGVRLFALAQAPPPIDTTTEPRFTIGQDTIPEGEPVLFIVETDPPGYEDEITRLSGTESGHVRGCQGGWWLCPVRVVNSLALPS